MRRETLRVLYLPMKQKNEHNFFCINVVILCNLKTVVSFRQCVIGHMDMVVTKEAALITMFIFTETFQGFVRPFVHVACFHSEYLPYKGLYAFFLVHTFLSLSLSLFLNAC